MTAVSNAPSHARLMKSVARAMSRPFSLTYSTPFGDRTVILDEIIENIRLS